MEKIECSLHGKQIRGRVCTHIAHAVDKGECVGFYWDDEDPNEPIAWCAECDAKYLALDGASCQQWVTECDFKDFCLTCWTDAKQICGGFDRE